MTTPYDAIIAKLESLGFFVELDADGPEHRIICASRRGAGPFT